MITIADSHNPERSIQRALLNLQVKEFIASGGKIKKIPAGASAMAPAELPPFTVAKVRPRG